MHKIKECRSKRQNRAVIFPKVALKVQNLMILSPSLLYLSYIDHRDESGYARQGSAIPISYPQFLRYAPVVQNLL